MTLSKRICALAVCATLVLLQSCAKEELDLSKLNQFSEPKSITVSASLPQASNTQKTTININDNGKVLWESTDAISVNGTTLSDIYINPTDKTSATFMGEASPLETTHYWGVYPTSIATDKNTDNYTTSIVNVRLPLTQNYKHDTIPSFMVAYFSTSDDDITLNFKNICSIIRIPVQAASGVTSNSAKLKRIVVESTQNISGNATVNWNIGNPIMTIKGNNSVILDCGKVDVSSQKEFYIMLPASTTGTQTLTIKFYDNNGKYMQKKLTGISLTRSQIITTNVVNLNATTDAPWESGDFSVSSTKKVKFSPSNLQYQASTKTWRFAEHQYDYVGDASNGNIYVNNTKCDNNKIDKNYTGWIDLFGWGCTGYQDTRSNAKNHQKNYQPYSSSATVEDATYNYYGYGPDYRSSTQYSLTVASKSDWGCLAIYNQHTSTTDPSGTWRTLTGGPGGEWEYLLNSRVVNGGSGEGYSYQRTTLTLSDGTTVYGLLLLPDNFTGSVSATTSWSDWQNLEKEDVVFLPAGGYRKTQKQIENAGSYGYYWSTTYFDCRNAYFLFFTKDNVDPLYYYYRCNGRLVRLVKDAN